MMKKWLAVFVLLCAALSASPIYAATCESLLGLKLENTTITAAQMIEPGAFKTPGDAVLIPGTFTAFNTLPAFCRVQGVSRPSNDSNIEFEVWLPASNWSGRYLGAGNGGFAGYINCPGLAGAVMNGDVGSSTDTGHKASPFNAEWGLGRPEKIVDYGYRAIHETANNAKTIIRAFYGSSAKQSCFCDCSNGGRQALMEAQRYPEDYDGIIAGAPATFYYQTAASFVWNAKALESDPASFIRPGKLPAIEAATLAACGTLDGVKDGVIDDPTKCRFNPKNLLCDGPETDSCLTQPQVAALEKVYSGPRNSKGEQLYPGIMTGGETGSNGWAPNLTGSAPGRSSQYQFMTQGGKYLFFQDPSWDYRSFSFDTGIKQAEAVANIMDPTNPDLTAFKKRGGKMIIYHGWADAILPPLGTVKYYEGVVSKMGKRTADDFIRLYMVPGMQHCAGGPGPTSFGLEWRTQDGAQHSISASLVRWAEKGTAPDKIIATKYKTDGNPASGVVRTRPLCPYPQVAKYKGSGGTDDAANFVCSENK